MKTLSGFPAFEAGEVETNFIDRFRSELLPTEDVSNESGLSNVLMGTRSVRYGGAIVAIAICLSDPGTCIVVASDLVPFLNPVTVKSYHFTVIVGHTVIFDLVL